AERVSLPIMSAPSKIGSAHSIQGRDSGLYVAQQYRQFASFAWQEYWPGGLLEPENRGILQWQIQSAVSYHDARCVMAFWSLWYRAFIEIPVPRPGQRMFHFHGCDASWC